MKNQEKTIIIHGANIEKTLRAIRVKAYSNLIHTGAIKMEEGDKVVVVGDSLAIMDAVMDAVAHELERNEISGQHNLA